jgi:glycerophosphoryl diester phosphodiesterase
MNIICYGAGRTDKPENTLMAIEHCVQLNKNWTVHIDIHLSKDGEVILFKDDNTKRISNQDLEISNLNFQEIQQLDAAYNFQQNDKFPLRGKKVSIPTLKEVFELYPNTKFILDIQSKDNSIIDKVIQLIKAYKLADNIILTSKQNHIISAFRTKEEKWHYAATTVRARKIIYSNMFYLDSIIPVDAHLMIIPKCDKDSLFLRERIIAYCNQQNKKTWTWIFEGASNDYTSMLKQINELETQGLIGIFTSSPVKMQNALNSRVSSNLNTQDKVAS